MSKGPPDTDLRARRTATLPRLLMLAASVLAIVGAVLLALGLSQLEVSTERGCPASTTPGPGTTCQAAMVPIDLAIILFGLCAALALASRSF